MDDELRHHGVLGMKWGIRRYQPYPKGYSGDGRFLGKAGKAARDTAGKVVKYAGKGAKAVGRGSVKTAKAVGRGIGEAHERHVVARNERRVAKFIATGGVGDKKRMSRLSSEELERVSQRLSAEKDILSMNAEMRKNRFSSQLAEHVITRVADKSVDLAFSGMDKQMEAWIKAPKGLAKKAEEAENRAKIAKAEADIVGAAKKKVSESAQIYDQRKKLLENKKELEEYKSGSNSGESRSASESSKSGKSISDKVVSKVEAKHKIETDEWRYRANKASGKDTSDMGLAKAVATTYASRPSSVTVMALSNHESGASVKIKPNDRVSSVVSNYYELPLKTVLSSDRQDIKDYTANSYGVKKRS